MTQLLVHRRWSHVVRSCHRIAAATVLVIATAPSTFAISVLDSEGLSFGQLDLSFPDISPQPNSQYALAIADIDQLLTNKGMLATGGFLNVATSEGWVVQNLPLTTQMLAAGSPGLTMMFDLGVNPGDVSSLNATADLSPNPVTSFALAGSSSFNVTAIDWNAQGGVNTITATDIRSGPTDHHVEKVTFNGADPPISGMLQPNHADSIEQLKNQCGPGALANSMRYLNDRFDVAMPHAFEPNGAPNSILDEIDGDMNRLPNRGVTRDQFLNGKLRYIDDHVNGQPKLRVKGYGIGGDRTIGDTTIQDQTVSSGLSLVDWLLRELEHGEDVELWMDWVGGGAHLVTLTGGGRIFGRPYFTWIHDAVQDDDTQGTGLQDGGHGFSYFDENRNNFINFIGDEQLNNATFRFAVSESVPEPLTAALCLPALIMLCAHRLRRQRPGMADLARNSEPGA